MLNQSLPRLPFCFLPFSACGARQEVSFEQGQALAAEHGKGVRFFETSARSNLNVTEAFEGLATDVILRYARERRAGKGVVARSQLPSVERRRSRRKRGRAGRARETESRDAARAVFFFALLSEQVGSAGSVVVASFPCELIEKQLLPVAENVLQAIPAFRLLHCVQHGTPLSSYNSLNARSCASPCVCEPKQ